MITDRSRTITQPIAAFTPVPCGVLQRRCACGAKTFGGAKCSKCEADEKQQLPIQRKVARAGNIEEVPPIVNEVLRSSGQPLDPTTRATMEGRFGHDFSQVRVHTDAKAAESAKSVSALAYTVGRNVVFGMGHYVPESREGRSVLAHELTHVVQQRHAPLTVTSDLKISTPTDSAENEANSTADAIRDDNRRPAINAKPGFSPVELQRLCSAAAICAAPIAGSVEEFRTSSAATEVGPRERRKKMTPAKAIASGHSGRALQLEKFLEAQIPGRLANVQGIFIDWDMDAAAMVQDCAAWISDALPAGTPTPPGMAGAGKPCMFVPGPLNSQALAFNTTSKANIGGKPREEWRVGALQDLTHEVEHIVFDTAAHSTPPGVTTATCTRANIGETLSEMAAFISEFPIVFRAIPAGASATDPMQQRMAKWFNFVLKDAANNFKGMQESMGCQCECAEVDKFVIDTFNFESASWTKVEKNAFHTELQKPAWGLRWPLAPVP